MKNIIHLLLFSLLLLSCSKDDVSVQPKPDSTPPVSCSAGCSSMSWKVTKETGSVTRSESCTIQYVGSAYIQTCTGNVTYSGSGKTYSYKVIYDWVKCKISVDVAGVGKCEDG